MFYVCFPLFCDMSLCKTNCFQHPLLHTDSVSEGGGDVKSTLPENRICNAGSGSKGLRTNNAEPHSHLLLALGISKVRNSSNFSCFFLHYSSLGVVGIDVYDNVLPGKNRLYPGVVVSSGFDLTTDRTSAVRTLDPF